MARQYIPPKQDLSQIPPDQRAAAQRQINSPILLMGHTEDTGDSAADLALSVQRATAVAQVFKDAGVDPARIYVHGAGDSLPIADNNNPETKDRNRRVEILDFPSRPTMEQFVQSQKTNPQYMAAVKRAPLPKEPEIAAAPIEPQVAPETMPEEPAAPVITREMRAAFIDFGGHQPTDADKNIALAAIGAPKKAYVAFGLIGSAQAATPATPACIDERQQPTSKAGPTAPLKVTTADYIPGMYDVVWSASVNGHLVALNTIAVKRNGAESLRNPLFEVFKNFDRQKNKTSMAPTSSTPTTVVTYEGTSAFLYRIFFTADAPALCADLALPYTGTFEALTGRLYYRELSGDIAVAEFAPKKLAPGPQ